MIRYLLICLVVTNSVQCLLTPISYTLTHVLPCPRHEFTSVAVRFEKASSCKVHSQKTNLAKNPFYPGLPNLFYEMKNHVTLYINICLVSINTTYFITSFVTEPSYYNNAAGYNRALSPHPPVIYLFSFSCLFTHNCCNILGCHS